MYIYQHTSYLRIIHLLPLIIIIKTETVVRTVKALFHRNLRNEIYSMRQQEGLEYRRLLKQNAENSGNLLKGHSLYDVLLIFLLLEDISRLAHIPISHFLSCGCLTLILLITSAIFASFYCIIESYLIRGRSLTMKIKNLNFWTPPSRFLFLITRIYLKFLKLKNPQSPTQNEIYIHFHKIFAI